MTGLISKQFRMPRCGVNEEPFIGALNNVNLALLKRFNAAGFEFAFPTQTVYHQAIDKA